MLLKNFKRRFFRHFLYYIHIYTKKIFKIVTLMFLKKTFQKITIQLKYLYAEDNRIKVIWNWWSGYVQ